MRIATTCMIVLIGHSCVQEDLGRCPRVTRVYFKFAQETSFNGTKTEETVNRIDVYAFDEADKLAGYWTDEQVRMSEDYYIALDNLAAGTYRLVAWTNLGEYYVSNTLRDDQARGDYNVSLVLPEDRKLRDGILPHLQFGESLEANVDPFGENRIEILLDDNLYKLNFTIEGIEPDEDIYQFTVTDNNASYTFDNSYEETPAFEYISSACFDNSARLGTSMLVLRLDKNRQPGFAFTNETRGKEIFSCNNLVELILQANLQGAAIDFCVTHEFDITLRIYADTRVSVSINGWSIETDEVQVY